MERNRNKKIGGSQGWELLKFIGIYFGSFFVVKAWFHDIDSIKLSWYMVSIRKDQEYVCYIEFIFRVAFCLRKATYGI